MPQCQTLGCLKNASGEYPHCKKCYYSKRGRKNRDNGFFRMIVHAACSQYEQNEENAISSKTCGVCNKNTEVDSRIEFITICTTCAHEKDSNSLVAMSESTYDDFCKICKKIIGKTKSKPIHEKKKEVQQPQSDKLSPSQIAKDLSRIMNGVVRIKRTTLLDRLIKECEYTMKQASIAVSSMLATGSYIEDDGMILLQRN